MPEITELSDDENIVLECAQEAELSAERVLVDAADVVRYALANDVPMTMAKATRILAGLAAQGLLVRQARASRGWGQGWYPSTYRVAKTAMPTGAAAPSSNPI